MEPMPHLTIQIVTWNSADDLRESLPVLANMPASEVVIRVVDNGSRDNSVSMVKQYLPHADVIELAENRGFSGGHNVALAKCQTEFIMLYNPDLNANWRGIQKVLEVFEDKKVGSAQGLLLRTASLGREEQIDSAGIVMTKALNGQERGAGEKNVGQYDQQDEIDACTGAAAIYRVTALREVAFYPPTGGDIEVLDQDFMAYKEDVDLGWRLRKAGWKNMFVPVVQGMHTRSLSIDIPLWQRMNDVRTRYSFRNWIWMIYKNATFKELLLHEISIDARLFVFFLLTLRHPSFFKVWLETWLGLPKIIRKR
jgi:GT2 family glycosyltransferase